MDDLGTQLARVCGSFVSCVPGAGGGRVLRSRERWGRDEDRNGDGRPCEDAVAVGRVGVV